MNRHWQPWTTGEIKRVSELVEQGFTLREVAPLVGRSLRAVRHLAWRESIQTARLSVDRGASARVLSARSEIEASGATVRGSELMDVASRLVMNLTDLRRVIAALVATPNGRTRGRGSRLLRVQTGWADLAACRGADPGIFYVDRGQSQAPAIAICLDCPVRVECLVEAVRNREHHGVWGGTTERGRRRVAKLVASIAENSEAAS